MTKFEEIKIGNKYKNVIFWGNRIYLTKNKMPNNNATV